MVLSLSLLLPFSLVHLPSNEDPLLIKPWRTHLSFTRLEVPSKTFPKSIFKQEGAVHGINARRIVNGYLSRRKPHLIWRVRDQLGEGKKMVDCRDELVKSLSEQGLALSFTQGKGRCLIADRNFSPGEVVISQEPYASVVDTSCHGQTCDSCFSSHNSLKKCSVCKMVWYCGSSCQKAQWKLHQLECQALVSLSKEKRKMLTPSVRLMVRILIRRKQQIEKRPSQTMEKAIADAALENAMFDY